MATTPTATDLQEAAESAAKGRRDPAAVKKACEEMDRIRADVKRRLGVVEVAVDLVREARNAE
jgi:hypothetical protein